MSFAEVGQPYGKNESSMHSRALTILGMCGFSIAGSLETDQCITKVYYIQHISPFPFCTRTSEHKVSNGKMLVLFAIG
jgi:hypothetical protein